MRFAQIGASLLAAFTLGTEAPALQAGTVLTRNGTIYTGNVQFRTNNQVVVTPLTGPAVTLPLAKVARVKMQEEADAPDTPTHPDPQLPLPWQQTDIGQIKEPGTGSENHGLFTLRGAGWGLWGSVDSFHFVHQPLAGDFDMMTQVGELPKETDAFVAGLTVRETLEADSAQASILIYPGGRLRMSCRPVDPRAEPALLGAGGQYHWVRLVRSGNLFSGFASIDGQTWELAGTVTVDMAPSVHAGLACAATLNHLAVGTTFGQVRIVTQTMGPQEGLVLTDGSVVAGRTKQLDEAWLTYLDPTGQERQMPATAVAFLFTRPLPPDHRVALGEGNQGISLVTGDQVEGSVQGVRKGKVTVTSVLFGQQTLPLSQVLAVLLRPAGPAGSCSVSTKDGSVHRCTQVTAGDGVVTAAGGVAGQVILETTAISEVDLGDLR